jgi:hypothetical protein
MTEYTYVTCKMSPRERVRERKGERGGVIKNNNVIKITVNLPQA